MFITRVRRGGFCSPVRTRCFSAASTTQSSSDNEGAFKFLFTSSIFVGVGLATTASVARAESNSRDTLSENHPVCGQWCASPNEKETKCTMDQDIIPCRGQWCTTTCGLWNVFVLGNDDKRRPVSCSMYASGLAFPRGAEICSEDCLTPEVRQDRYPAPTGYGIMCRPNTCSPGATPLKNVGKALGELQCPCNWFGSECTDDWIPVTKVRKDGKLGPLELVTLILDTKSWNKVVQDYRPGGVVRIAHLDTKTGVPREMACALASFDKPGELTFLMSPADPSLRPETRQVADRIYGMQKSGPVNNLYVNPSISGFFNGDYDYLLDYMRQNDKIRRIVVLSSGAGLGGALSAVDAILKENQSNKEEKSGRPTIEIHLYYGLRVLEHLPCRDRLEELASSGDVQLTLVLSGGPDVDDEELQDMSSEIQAAVRRGDASRRLQPVDEMKNFVSQLSQPYTQHVVGLDLSSQNGSLRKSGASLEDTVFVACGRVEILRDTGVILEALNGGNSKLVSEHLFTNI